jgi:hypothetical protein
MRLTGPRGCTGSVRTMWTQRLSLAVRALPCLAFVSIAAAACGGPGAPPDERPGATQTEIAMTAYLGDLRTIPLAIGDWTGKVLFDTGGGLSLVTPAVADSIGCTPVGRLTGFRYDGESIHAPGCGVMVLASGSWSDSTELAVFDLMALLGDAPPLDGLVGLPVFEGRLLTIDLPQNRLLIEDPRPDGPGSNARPLQVRASRQAGGAGLDVFVAVRTPRGPIWLELDSGNIGPVLLAPHAAAMLGIAAETETPSPVRLDVVGLGEVELEAVVRDGIYDGLLNAAFFRQYVITLDLDGIRAWATPARRPS